MQTMADITVTSIGTRQFHAQIRDNDLETSHHVTVPKSLINELQLPKDSPDKVVRESFFISLGTGARLVDHVCVLAGRHFWLLP
jgi:hypothetical protein